MRLSVLEYETFSLDYIFAPERFVLVYNILAIYLLIYD